MNAKPVTVDYAQTNTPAVYTPEPQAGDSTDSIARHDSWAMSFIDLLMLLLTLFVLLLSFKNDGDSKKSPLETLNITPQLLTIVQEDTLEAAPPLVLAPKESSELQPVTEAVEAPVEIIEPQDTRSEMINDIVEKLNKDYVQQDPEHNEVQITATTHQINLEISEAILFAPASDDLTARGEQVLKQLAGVLVGYPFRLSVEGHTDNLPISSARFPSNWELSTSRATKVTRKLIDYGYPAVSIRSIGYGDTKPLADNNAPEGREKNRRVSIVMDLPGDDVGINASN